MNKATRKKRAQHLVQDETSNCYNVYTRIYTEELLSETAKSYSLLSVGDELASCRRGCRRIQHPTENPRNSSPLFFFLHPTTLHPGWFKLYFFFSNFFWFDSHFVIENGMLWHTVSDFVPPCRTTFATTRHRWHLSRLREFYTST